MTPPAVDMRSVRRALIIKMSALGDVIHALPAAAAIKSAFPHVQLSWITEETYAPLLTGNPTLDSVLTLPRGRGREKRSLGFLSRYFQRIGAVRSAGFDITIDLQGLSKSAWVAVVSGAPIKIGYHWLREAAPLVERPVPRRPESVHVVDQYLDVARFLGADFERAEFPFHVPDEDDAAAVEMLAEQGIARTEPFIAINPASGLAIKQWDCGRFTELIDSLPARTGMRAVLVTADRVVAGQVAEAARTECANLAGRTNLKQLAAVLRRSAMHVCGDTGSGHLAAALGRPVVQLVGPTDADRTCPYGQRDNVIERHSVCGPNCSPHYCQYDRPRCLDMISVEDVLVQLERVLQGSGQIL